MNTETLKRPAISPLVQRRKRSEYIAAAKNAVNTDYGTPYDRIECSDQFRFESLLDFVLEVERMHTNHVASVHALEDGMDSMINMSETWCKNTDLEAAITLAKTGWVEGSESLQAARLNAQQFVHSRPIETPANDVLGACVDIGEYLENAPECFITMHQEVQEVPMIKLCFDLGLPGASDEDVFINRGLAFMTLIDRLENEGARVEVWGILSFNRQHYTGCDAYIKLKDFDAPWSPMSIAFPLMHPAMLRRLGFRFVEATNSTVVHSNYGAHMMYIETKTKKHFDYMLEGYDNEYYTVRQAMETVDKLYTDVHKNVSKLSKNKSV